MRKILCLDIDGVLWNTAWGHYLHSTENGKKLFQNLTEKKNLITPLSPENISSLNVICENIPELEIVITSSWIRLDSSDEKSKFYKFIERHLKEAGFEYFNKIQTEWDGEKEKKEKLKNVLKDSNMTMTQDSIIVIVDDQDYYDKSWPSYCNVVFQKILSYTGLTIKDADDIIKYFGVEPKLPMVIF